MELANPHATEKTAKRATANRIKSFVPKMSLSFA